MTKYREIFGINIAGASKESVLSLVDGWIASKRRLHTKFITTVYSESILEALSNFNFMQALDRSDLVLADGVSVAAAVEYLHAPLVGPKKLKWIVELLRGILIGKDILLGKFPRQTVTGVGLMEELIKQAVRRDYRVTLLGGYGNTAEELRGKLKAKHKGLKINSEPGPEEIKEISQDEESLMINKINASRPDLLFVAMGRFKQELWIFKNLDRLQVKVVMGVGSAFDEMLGQGIWKGGVPAWASRRGLKWLWRSFRDTTHLRRALRAAIVFPWFVYLERVKGSK